MKFSIQATDQKARAGCIVTAHSKVLTPVFMPVGTVASVKALDFIDLTSHIKPEIILANTYHLYLRPGADVVQKLGGLHKFSGFKKSFLTDSGGFQAFSLKAKLSDDGVSFVSHIDGSRHFFSPSKVIDIQKSLNSDIMMVLDDLAALPATQKRIEESIKRTTLWAKLSLEYFAQNQSLDLAQDPSQDPSLALDTKPQNLFAIVQGGTNYQHRKISAQSLQELEGKNSFDGFAIGGLSVGEPIELMHETLSYTPDFLPTNRPRYLMGVGTPKDIVIAIDNGVDMFDCVMPTRNARNGTLFTSKGRVNIKNTAFKTDPDPIDKACSCYTCRNFSAAYLSHLFRAKELSYFRLASLHNLHYYLDLMSRARTAIINGKWAEFKNEILEVYK